MPQPHVFPSLAKHSETRLTWYTYAGDGMSFVVLINSSLELLDNTILIYSPIQSAAATHSSESCWLYGNMSVEHKFIPLNPERVNTGGVFSSRSTTYVLPSVIAVSFSSSVNL